MKIFQRYDETLTICKDCSLKVVEVHGFASKVELTEVVDQPVPGTKCGECGEEIKGLGVSVTVFADRRRDW